MLIHKISSQWHCIDPFVFWQCHYSYNACGLGSDGTDRLVNMVQEVQHRKTSQDGGPSLFGAKITGGGSGGSVCVIGKNCLKSSEEIFEVFSTSFFIVSCTQWMTITTKIQDKPSKRVVIHHNVCIFMVLHANKISFVFRFRRDTKLLPGTYQLFSRAHLQVQASLDT
jgi:hypothetical protein